MKYFIFIFIFVIACSQKNKNTKIQAEPGHYTLIISNRDSLYMLNYLISIDIITKVKSYRALKVFKMSDSITVKNELKYFTNDINHKLDTLVIN